MPEHVDGSRNPRWMTLLVVPMFGAGLAHLTYMFTGAYAPYGNLYPAAMALVTVMAFAGLSGVMSAEKWGVWVFGIAVVCTLAVSLFAGAFHWGHLLLLIPAGIFFSRIGSFT